MNNNNKLFHTNLIPEDNLISLHSTKFSDLDKLLKQIKSETDCFTLVQMKQTHSANIIILDGDIENNTKIVLQNTDAVFTMKKNTVLTIKSADCLPILVYHPSGLIGAIHAGRKGTEKKITQKALSLIKSKFAIDKDFVFWFGPAICSGCYQIDEAKDLYYDLKAENLNQILSELKPDGFKINYSSYCTSCDNDLFFSYRKENGITGRIYHAIALK
ncbi:polyphenol oxidase family protein [Candidatus Margulisiibacteriota bacterium]